MDGSWIPGTGTDNGGNLDKAPLFMAPDAASSGSPATGGNYRLRNGSGGTEGTEKSPAINAGSNSLYPANADDPIFSGISLSAGAKAAINAALQYDRDGAGHPRTKGGAIDMGAYEKE
jgi:hypothetical protein